MARQPTFSFDESIGFVVNRTAMRLASALTKALAPQNVTPQQWAVLNRLWQEDGLSQQQLAEQTFRDPPNTARILDRLQHKGLITREPDPTDRRVQLIFLTEQGCRLRGTLPPLAEQVLARSLEGLSQEDVDDAIRVLKRIDQNLQ
jgi:DNA-binding MarR family transcriptional regulator